jgi:hypothetical protein
LIRRNGDGHCSRRRACRGAEDRPYQNDLTGGIGAPVRFGAILDMIIALALVGEAAVAAAQG